MFGRFQQQGQQPHQRPPQATSSAVSTAIGTPTNESEFSYGSFSPDQEAEGFGDFPACGTQAVVEKKGGEWLHGEVQFEETNLRSKYLIVPEGVSDAGAVIAVMCSLWDLQVPELFLAFNGGQDTAAGMLANVLDRDVWQCKGISGKQASVMNFNECLVKTSKGIATACSESKAWVFGFDGSYGCQDGDEMWGTCFNTGWSYFGQGRRSCAACQSVEFICAKGLRGMFGERKFRNHAVHLSRNVDTVMFYPSVSDRLQKDGKAVPDCVAEASGRMNRPRRSQLIWPEFTHILLFDGDACKDPFPDIYEAMRSITSTVHVVLGGVHPTLTNSVVEESANVPVVILRHTGGSADVIAKALDTRQKQGSDQIEAKYSQSADELLSEKPEWRSLKWSAKYPHTSLWSLPASAQRSNFVVVDVKRDSIRSVVDKILHVFSYTDDMETRQPGGVELERDHVQEAWKWAVTFKYNAGFYKLINSTLTYTIMVLILLTVILVSLHISAKFQLALAPGSKDDYSQPRLVGSPLPEWLCQVVAAMNLHIVVIVLLCLIGFAQTCLSSFGPYIKWCQLVNASNLIKEEVYRYRMRLRDYSRRPGHAFSVQKHIRRMPAVHRELLRKKTVQVTDSVIGTPRDTSDSPHPRSFAGDDLRLETDSKDTRSTLGARRQQAPPEEPLLQSTDDMPMRKRGSRKGVKTRRSVFHDSMEHIHNELGNAVRPSSLSEPPQEAFRNERLSLVGACDNEDTANDSAGKKGDKFEATKRHQDSALGRAFDDGFATLVVEDYLRFRLQPAITELSKIARSHGHYIFGLEALRYLVTLGSIMLGLLGEIMVVPTAVTCICLITHFLHFHQFRMRLQSVNTALTDLQNLTMWWESLDILEQRMKHMVEHVVDVTETAMLADFLVARKVPAKPTSNKESAELTKVASDMELEEV